ncbi:MAG: hypothetical protein IRZ07_25345, partial [Microbispora sp.]|nr:hypothetical protein [Microbispora sp.]
TGPNAFSPSSTGPTAFSPSSTGPNAFSPSSTGPTAFSPSSTGPNAFSPSSTGSDAASGPAGTEAAPASAGGSGAFAAEDPGSSTGPLPSVGDESLERGDEYLPIFASVESAWFRRPDTRRQAAQDKPGGEPGESTGEIAEAAASSGTAGAPQEHDGTPGEWRSRADSGFRAAASVRDPLLGGVTAAGLPKRKPKANLVPGSVSADGPAAVPRPPVSAEAVRNRLSSFQQGVRRGRAEAAGGLAAEGSGKEEEGS